MRALPLIAEQEAAVTELDSMMKADIAGLERGAYGGMAARMEALHRSGTDSSDFLRGNWSDKNRLDPEGKALLPRFQVSKAP